MRLVSHGTESSREEPGLAFPAARRAEAPGPGPEGLPSPNASPRTRFSRGHSRPSARVPSPPVSRTVLLAPIRDLVGRAFALRIPSRVPFVVSSASSQVTETSPALTRVAHSV